MKLTTLKFPTILLLIDFQMVTKTESFQINNINLTLTGEFSEADIELAKYGYHAEVLSTI
jgi:hypothetical protein